MPYSTTWMALLLGMRGSKSKSMRRTVSIIPLFITLIIFGCKSTPDHSTTNNKIITDKYWKLIELNGKRITAEQQAKEAYFVLKTEENRITGNGGCNSFFGTYQLLPGNSIQISPLGSTKMACLNDNVEDEFLKILAITDNYTIKNDTLSLNKARMALLAKFELVIK